MRNKNFFVILFTIITLHTYSQINNTEIESDIYNPKEYTIGGINVTGTENLDNNAIIMLSNLNVGDKITIPSEQISGAISKLWDQGLFSEVNILTEKIVGDNIFLIIELKERPRLYYYKFSGLKKREENDLKELLKISKGDIVTDNLIKRSNSQIVEHFTEKGYLFTDVNCLIKRDSLPLGQIALTFEVKKHNKMRINKINIRHQDIKNLHLVNLDS